MVEANSSNENGSYKTKHSEYDERDSNFNRDKIETKQLSGGIPGGSVSGASQFRFQSEESK